MINETLGMEKMEISDMIREIRIKRNIPQKVLYDGLCGRKKYFQLENGDVVMDELLSERLFSRLHVQYHLIDIMLDDIEFWQKECRYEINLQIRKKCWEQAEVLLKEYEAEAPKESIHKQYMMAKRAEIFYKTKEEQSGRLFATALELTMSITEIEKRLKTSGVVAEEELWLYFRYRSCENPFSLEEYALFLTQVEQWFLNVQIHPEVYFEAAYQYACELYKAKHYVTCREICRTAIGWLKHGKKTFYLAEFYFLDAITGMHQKHSQGEERELFQQSKMAYYLSETFGDREGTKKMAMYCEEALGWHITV